MGKTTYVVLKRVSGDADADGNGDYRYMGTVETRSAELACDRIALEYDGGDLAAIPARYWKPDLYSVVTERRVVRGVSASA